MLMHDGIGIVYSNVRYLTFACGWQEPVRPREKLVAMEVGTVRRRVDGRGGGMSASIFMIHV